MEIRLKLTFINVSVVLECENNSIVTAMYFKFDRNLLVKFSRGTCGTRGHHPAEISFQT